MKHANISLILVEPMGPINIGACCRSMMNFSFSDLRLVNPCRNYKSKEARKMALNAKEMLSTASAHRDIASATADIHVIFGTTRRFGKYRKDFITPEKTAALIEQFDDNTQCAIVFGREDTGLTTEELKLCHYFVTIPTHSSFPSMNLSHAVTVILYELNKILGRKNRSSENNQPLATGREIEMMYNHMKSAFLDMAYLDPQNPDHLLKTYRRIFGRAGLYRRDVRIIRGLLSRIEWIVKKSAGTND